MESELKCPITFEYFVDPVSVPCCGKAFSREPLVSWYENDTTCPLCRNDMQVGGFDPRLVAKNVILESLVQAVATGASQRPPSYHEAVEAPVAPVDPQEHRWTCDVTPICEGSSCAELRLRLDKGRFKTQPALFVAVVDESGSMRGDPMKQVSMALHHICELAKVNPQVSLVTISYSSGAVQIKDPSEYGTRVGGTNFRAAFSEVERVLIQHRGTGEGGAPLSAVSIAFMTDGQDQSGKREALPIELRALIQNSWGYSAEESPVSVHTIGFGSGVDRDVLEAMQECGTVSGLYRYADPGDDGDTLCGKLTGIFEFSSQAGSVPLTASINGEVKNLRLHVDAHGRVDHREWVQMSAERTGWDVILNSSIDCDVRLVVSERAPTAAVMQRWLSKCTDGIAAKILEFSNQKGVGPDIRGLQCAILEKSLDAIHARSDGSDDRAVFLRSQVDALRAGSQVSINKLSDMRFSSLFSSTSKLDTTRSDPVIRSTVLPPQPVPLVIPAVAHYERDLRKYSRNNAGKGRTPLQEAICTQQTNTLPPHLQRIIDQSSVQDICESDGDSNNAIMLAAYCGHAMVLSALLKRLGNSCTPEVLDTYNGDDETAVTLAIKARGFHACMESLLAAGANIPGDRRNSLQRYAIDKEYTRTAQMISNLGNAAEGDLSITPDASAAYLTFAFERAKKSNQEWDKEAYLNVALARKMKDVTKELLGLGAVPTIEMLIEHCIPPKPDHPKEMDYLEYAKVLLESRPELIHDATKPEEETALYAATRKGSLSHVKYFISLGANIEAANEKGNTPLWLASFQRFPCIMEELIRRGADVNRPNLKGNPPMYGPCCRGPPKIAELLLSMGANVESFNANGDTLILLCCRNGTTEVLQLLLNYVDEDHVNFRAKIDGFNAIMASAEADKPECIRVLSEYGCDLDARTDEDNPILPGATPLHIAAYYNRMSAAAMLLQLGADANAQTTQGLTPLHIAVMQANVDIVRILREKADLFVVDGAGNTADAYCRNNKELARVLINPLLDPLLRLSKGGFSPSDESVAIQILQDCGVPGVVPPQKLLDIHDTTGTTILGHAVQNSKRELVGALLDLGCSPNVSDILGVRLHTWAKWSRNARIIKLVENAMGDVEAVRQSDVQLKNLTAESQRCPASSSILLLGLAPQFKPDPPSSISDRMSAFINSTRLCGASGSYSVPDSVCKLALPADNLRVPGYFEDVSLAHIKDPSTLYKAKIQTIRHVAAGSDMGAPELLAMSLYSSNPGIATVLNSQLMQGHFQSDAVQDYSRLLQRCLDKIKPYDGEAFMAAEGVDRRLFVKGTEFTWGRFISASTMWKVALENTSNFATKARKGTVFLIKSKTGRVISQYSHIPSDAEVVFGPKSVFRVTDWYHGDVICLGQENIRKHSFGVKDRDNERLPLASMLSGQKSLIIELSDISE